MICDDKHLKFEKLTINQLIEFRENEVNHVLGIHFKSNSDRKFFNSTLYPA